MQNERKAKQELENARYCAGRKMLFGLAFIIIGGIFLLENMGAIDTLSAAHYWPLILGVFGLNSALFSSNARTQVHGLFEIFASIWIFACLEHLWGWTFLSSWPIILIALGICTIITSLCTKHHLDNESTS